MGLLLSSQKNGLATLEKGDEIMGNIFKGGYGGKILRINLTERSVSFEDLPEDMVRAYVGGRGFGIKMLYDEVGPQVSPLDPENKLIFVVGPLNGTPVQSSSRWMVVTKSPLSGGYIRSVGGANFGAEMKFAGIDVIVVEGKADRPVYLLIRDDNVEIKDATHLWGRLTNETEIGIREEVHDPKIRVACIGPSGEKLIRFAGIVSESRIAARGGVGAVMGSKNLKAIAIRGSKKVALAEKETIKEATKEIIEVSKKNPLFEPFSRLGTLSVVSWMHEMGVYPVRNFREGVLKGIECLDSEEFAKIKVKDSGCHKCYLHCGSIMQETEGPFAGPAADGPEYETTNTFGGLIGSNSRGLVCSANKICDDYGIDTISAGGTIAFAMELYERGIINDRDTDGIELRWGDHGAIQKILNKIVKREGFGAVLAEGVKRAAEEIGKGSDRFAMHVKGLEMPAYDPRAAKAHGLNLVTSNIGASHCLGFATQELFGEPEPVDRFAIEGKGLLAKQNQDFTTFFETGITCLFSFAFGFMALPIYPRLLSGVTGIEDFSDENYHWQVSERIWNLERAYNVREGFTRKDDNFPQRFLEDSPQNGPCKGQVVELKPMLDDYYEARGWNKETGIPTREKLEGLGLMNVADELDELGETS